MTVPGTPTHFTAANLADVQGFLTSGYGHLPFAKYLFLQIHDRQQAQRWLGRLASAITTSSPWPVASDGSKIKPSSALNIAFTAAGLASLGLPQTVLCTFPVEFQENVALPHRSIILGDTEESSPRHWELGGPDNPPIHAVLLVHGATGADVELICNLQHRLIEDSADAITEVPGSAQSGYRPESNREPFGFHDGISQPSIRGISADGGVPTGEFILGYPNHYQILPPTPVVPADLDGAGILPAWPNPYHAGEGLRDMGLNGSFVVYRKLQQDVASFWQFMKREAVRARGQDDPLYMVWLASRFVGRWPSGAPLAMAPDADSPRLGDRNDFTYKEDAEGFACPLGAHVRRTNPRDVIAPYTVEQSLSMSEAHRLLRRGRMFGPPLFDPQLLDDPVAPASAKALTEVHGDGEARGVHFFCVNANIKSQFEFVQQTWCNNPHFSGLNDNKDPIAGDNGQSDEPSSHMTIPRRPVRDRTSALPRFVAVKGGAYLFMPSVTAVRFLATFGATQ